MIKVMLVDDEFIILDGLSSFPWDKYGSVVVATAQNGQAALKAAAEKHPDLIFTDIKMPGMDGLEFAAKLREIDQNVKIVFLTGYSNFEFAKQAISVGVSDYLLKPVNLVQLDQLITKLTAEIRDEASTRQYYEMLQTDFERQKPFLKERFISDLLRGRFYNRNDYESRARTMEVELPQYVCAAVTRDDADVAATAPTAYAVRNVCEEVAEEFCSTVLSEYDVLNQQYNLIFAFQADMDSETCMENSMKSCERLNAVLGKVINMQMSIGVSSVGADPYRLNEKFREACQANGQSVYLGEHAIVKYDDLDNRCGTLEIGITEGRKQHLFRSIYTGHSTSVAEELGAVLPDDLKVENARFMAMDLLIDCMQYPALCKISCDINSEEYDYSVLQDGLRVLSAAGSVREIREYLDKVFHLLSKQANTSADDRYNATVDSVLDYMKKNFQKDLSLDSVADHFHMSRTYMSRLLKKYSGHTFLNLLVGIRMDEARKLVVENEHKLYEIAEMVGYKDFSYFIQSFKKYYGVTPNEYRKTL